MCLKIFVIRGGKELFDRARDSDGDSLYGISIFERGGLNEDSIVRSYVNGILELTELSGDDNFIRNAYESDLDKILNTKTGKSWKEKIENYKKIMKEKMKELEGDTNNS